VWKWEGFWGEDLRFQGSDCDLREGRRAIGGGCDGAGERGVLYREVFWSLFEFGKRRQVGPSLVDERERGGGERHRVLLSREGRLAKQGRDCSLQETGFAGCSEKKVAHRGVLSSKKSREEREGAYEGRSVEEGASVKSHGTPRWGRLPAFGERFLERKLGGETTKGGQWLARVCGGRRRAEL